MTPFRHLGLLVQGSLCWAAFWICGLPAYYQQYSPVLLGIGCILITVATGLAAIAVLIRSSPDRRLERALWVSFYFTVPFAVFDSLYCGLYLGHGIAFLGTYWYLSVFYLVPWLVFPPTALLLRPRS